MKMTTEKAIQLVRERFPFEGYILAAKDVFLDIEKTVLRYLQPGSKILDFGCGPCDKTAVLQLLGFKCSAYDDLQDYWHKIKGNREKILAFTKDIGIDFKLAIDETLPFEKNYFDMIMMHSVLEHLHDSPRDLLNDLLELLKPEGLLFVIVPNLVNVRKRIDVFFGKTNLPSFESYYWFPGHWRGHIREYTKDDLVKLAKYLNLEILELRSCHHMLRKISTFVKPFYLALTKIFTGWRDSWLLVAKKKPGWVARKSLSKDELGRILEKYTSIEY